MMGASQANLCLRAGVDLEKRILDRDSGYVSLQHVDDPTRGQEEVTTVWKVHRE